MTLSLDATTAVAPAGRTDDRRPVAANHVPTSSPASAAAAWAAEVSSTGTPDWVAMATDSSLVTMPPVPTALPRLDTSTPSTSAGPATSGIRTLPARAGGPVYNPSTSVSSTSASACTR